MRTALSPLLASTLAFILIGEAGPSAAAAPDLFEIQVIDQATGRGIPLVELKTVSDMRFITDSAGRVALLEPGWFGKSVYFHLRSDGYDVRKDGFGFSGIKLNVRRGGKATVELKRSNIAERLYRVTGDGIYRDSVLLGYKSPINQPLLNAEVVGQDSVQATVYQDQIHWFWGDTDRAGYPLGQFRTAGAVSELPTKQGLNADLGVNLRYFTGSDGFSKPVCHLGFKHGLVWIDGVTTVPDEKGVQRLVCHYAHMKSLGEKLEHGLAVFNDEKKEFEKRIQLSLANKWRHPHDQATAQRPAGSDHIYFGYAFPNVRVKATLETVLDPAQYESWSCLTVAGSTVSRDKNGELNYRWSRQASPVDARMEQRLLKSGAINEDELRFLPRDTESGERIRMHRGSVRWNPYRNRWIMIANQEGGTSYLGEVWYSEADRVVGPWTRTRKIVTHDRYSFYNPVHHPFLDQADGRMIYFEGTYTTTFSGNPDKTPRYDYNQIMYRLDLKDQRLHGVQ